MMMKKMCHLPELASHPSDEILVFNEVKPHVLKEASDVADWFERMHRRIRSLPWLSCIVLTTSVAYEYIRMNSQVAQTTEKHDTEDRRT